MWSLHPLVADFHVLHLESRKSFMLLSNTIHTTSTTLLLRLLESKFSLMRCIRINVHSARTFCLRSALYSEVDQTICENPKNLCRDLQHPAALLLMFGKFNILLSQKPHMFVYCAWTLECADRAITKFMFQTGVAPWPFWSQRGAQNKDFWQWYYCKPHVEWLFW